MIVQSFGSLQAMNDRQAMWPGQSSGSVQLYDHSWAYAEIYKRQPNVRTCVDFLARNTAQLGLHVFRRVSDTDRVRLADHDLAAWLSKPNPATTRYRLTESLMGDLGIYFNAYWLKVRYPDAAGRQAIGLVRLPPEQMRVCGGLLPSSFVWTVDGREKEIPLSEVVHFDGFNPLNPLMGLSPLETLRRILAEEAAAGAHREAYWRNAGRMESVIQVTKDAKDYTPDQLKSFREQFQEFTGAGNKSGMTPIMPKGMELHAWGGTAKDAEYLGARKLSREECAAAYHIPLPMVGILEHATFSNIREQHKHLYQDTLGPWLEMIQQEIEGQLLTECEDQRDVYTEFNIAEKLKGSFEEQATSLRMLVGRPIMTANEGRARLNLPSIVDDPSADELAAQQGGPAGAAPTDATANPDDAPVAADLTPVIQSHRVRQTARLSKVPPQKRLAAFVGDLERWNNELANDLTPLVGEYEAVREAVSANVAMMLELKKEAVE